MTHTAEPDPLGSSVVSAPEGLNEGLAEAIDDYYDEPSRLQAEFLE
ncbi:MAG: hypothetical protein GX789_12905 [Pseudomonas formosensis]|nr:hypothetical protein [Halopseudomonas formosensis]